MIEERDPFFSFRIQEVIQETPDTKSFVLTPPAAGSVLCLSGQFLTFLFRNRKGEEVRRNYSVSSSPELGDPIRITVKRIPNGEFSRQLFDHAQPGDILKTIGASGFFTLPQGKEMPASLFFFAAGSGIAPVFSLIKTALHQDPLVKIVLIYSNPSESHTIFYQDLKSLQQAYPDRFQIEFLFSDAVRIRNRRLGIDLLEKLLLQYQVYQNPGTLFYLCGPFEYMRMITIVLRNQGFPAANIRKEIFEIHPPVQKTVPPDQDRHTIHLLLRDQEISFDTQYPETILQTAKRLHISLPYSCEAGQCGTCAATCLSGRVWMFKNEVLLEEEMAQGRVLTCTGFAVWGDVTIKYF
ncbi:MAG: ferredoxin--NADP reductase [Bacteroidota bacterium]|nr:ferredoxin--NADP reductase [Bacteroidota bacterium]